MKSLLISFFLLAHAEALIEFKYTQLYDMNDFHGTPYYPITNCEEDGCRVYLTYPNDDCPLGKCLGDQDNGPFTIEYGDNSTTFLELNKLRLDNGEKGYFDIPEGTKEFNIHNPNGNGVVRPLALWVVPNGIKSLQYMEVFEADDNVTLTTSTNSIVLLSVSPFTLTGSVEGEYELFVKTSPMDMINQDECEYVLDIGSTTSQTFSVPINSPLISLGFNSGGFTATLTTDHVFSYDRSIDQSGYFASPGYIGCANKTFVFRSESYNLGVTSFNETFNVFGDKARNVSFYGDLNTDESVPILLYDLDTNDEPMIIYGMQIENTSTWEYDMTTSKFSVFWDSSANYGFHNESFMIRYKVDLPVVSPMPSKPTVATVPTVPTVTVVITKPTVPTTKPTVPTTPAVSTKPTVPAVDATTELLTSTLAPDTSPLTSTTITTPTTSVSSLRSIIVAVFSVLIAAML